MRTQNQRICREDGEVGMKLLKLRDEKTFSRKTVTNLT